MGFSFLKKNNTKVKEEFLKPKALTLKDNVTQVVDFFKNEEKIDYKETLMILLRSLNFKELKEVMFSLESNKYNNLFWASEELRIYNLIYKKFIYGFETKVKQDFLEKYEEAKISLNTGDLVAFLLKHYFLFTQNSDEVLEPVINNILLKVVVCLKENIALLEKEMNHQLYVPISKALYVFFLYDKKEGKCKFNNIIRRDLESKNTSLYELEYMVTANYFFDRLNLDYIPRIDTVSEKFDLVIADKEISISKEEVFNEVDKGDYFNKKVPLLKLEKKYLFNNSKISKPKKTWLVLSTIINVFYEKTFDKKPSINIGDIFIETITNPYPKYSSYELIRTREILKEMFVLNDKFKIMFYSFFDDKKEDRSFNRNSFDAVRTKLPKILGEYFEGEDNFGATTVLKFLYEKNDNPVLDSIEEYQNFLKVNGLSC